MTASAVAQVVIALQAKLTAQLPVGFPVSIGAPPGGDIPNRYAAVAYGGDDRAGIVGQGEPGGAGNPTERSAETFGVWCTISAASGDVDGAGILATVDGLFQPVATSLRVDRQLGGLIVPPGLAEMGPYEWTVDDGGQIATVFFQVVCRLWWVA